MERPAEIDALLALSTEVLYAAFARRRREHSPGERVSDRILRDPKDRVESAAEAAASAVPGAAAECIDLGEELAFACLADTMFNSSRIKELERALRIAVAKVPGGTVATDGAAELAAPVQDDGEKVCNKAPKAAVESTTRTKEETWELIAAHLYHHHGVYQGSLDSAEPLSLTDLCEAISVKNGKIVKKGKIVSGWFKEYFGGHAEYAACCNRNHYKVASTLARLQGETLSPEAYTAAPPSDDGDDDFEPVVHSGSYSYGARED